MTDDEQLDAKVAEAMGFIVHKVIYGKWRCCKCRMCSISHYTGADFSLVKREIERREWEWVCRYRPARFGLTKPVYIFSIFYDPTLPALDCSAETEELAGCQAFLKAVEAHDEP